MAPMADKAGLLRHLIGRRRNEDAWTNRQSVFGPAMSSRREQQRVAMMELARITSETYEVICRRALPLGTKEESPEPEPPSKGWALLRLGLAKLMQMPSAFFEHPWQYRHLWEKLSISLKQVRLTTKHCQLFGLASKY